MAGCHPKRHGWRVWKRSSNTTTCSLLACFKSTSDNLQTTFYVKNGTLMTPNEIKKHIEAGLENTIAYVEGDGAHFTAAVISPLFAGKTRIQKQQLVYDTVRKQLLDGSLHALSITTFTPEEWQALTNDLHSEKP